MSVSGRRNVAGFGDLEHFDWSVIKVGPFGLDLSEALPAIG